MRKEQFWKESLHPYELAVDELVLKLQFVMKEHRDEGKYSPIEEVNGRVKTISSILSKAERKNIPLQRMDQILEKIEDIAGVRIICQFEADIYRVVKHLKKRTDMRVKSEEDYIANPKPSGYRSYHMIIDYQVQTSFNSYTIPVEIQIRTMAMDFWAVIEHSLQYKFQEEVPDPVRQRLMASAEAVVSLDHEMSAIRDEIVKAQTAFRTKANIVQDIMTRLAALGKVMTEEQITNLEKRFFITYNDENINQLKQFGDELQLLCNIQLKDKFQL